MGDEFEDFKRYFEEYQKRFGLLGYKVYFKYSPLGERFATIAINQNSMVANVQLNSRLPKEHKPNKDIRRDAKHEALHLLLGRVSNIMEARFVSEEEPNEAEEELVNRLMELINLDD
jgi:hypothetical protein